MTSAATETVGPVHIDPASRWGLGGVGLGLALFAGATVAVIMAVLVDRSGESAATVSLYGWTLATVSLINIVVFIGVPVLTSRRKGTGSLARDFGLTIRSRDVVAQWPRAGIGGLSFRGMLLRSLLRRNGPWLSVAASAALFGLPHIAGSGELGAVETARLASTVVFGVVFGGLAVGTERRLGLSPGEGADRRGRSRPARPIRRPPPAGRRRSAPERHGHARPDPASRGAALTWTGWREPLR